MRLDATLRTIGLWCGIAGPVLWLALLAVAGVMRPEFSHITNYISELGERGSSTELLVRYGAFVFTGFLYICFAGALPGALRAGWPVGVLGVLVALEGAGRMGAGVFPCEPGCGPVSSGPNFHFLFAAIGFGSGILAAIWSGVLVRRVPTLRSLSRFSVACGTVAFGSLAVMMWGEQSLVPDGLLEHLATVVLSTWLLVLASRLVWQGPPSRA